VANTAKNGDFTFDMSHKTNLEDLFFVNNFDGNTFVGFNVSSMVYFSKSTMPKKFADLVPTEQRTLALVANVVWGFVGCHGNWRDEICYGEVFILFFRFVFFCVVGVFVLRKEKRRTRSLMEGWMKLHFGFHD